MTANTSPIFTKTPDLAWGTTNPITTVNTVTTAAAYDGTTNANLIYTAGTVGSFIQKLVLEAGGANTTASVLRVHINNGSTNATAGNNSLYMQYSLPVVAAASNTAATAHIEVPLMLQLPANYRIYVSFGSSANLTGGWFVNAVAGDY